MKQSTIRRAMLIALWTVVISSFVLSFAGVRELGIQAGYHPILASLLPLCLVLSHHFVDTRSHNFVDMMSHLFVDIYNVTFWHAHVHA